MSRSLEQVLSLEDVIVDHYRRNGNPTTPTVKTQIQEEMDLHSNHHWDKNNDEITCRCGVQLYPDCDASSISIAEAHFLHVMKLFNIPIPGDFEIET